jgi:hypothetical protein
MAISEHDRLVLQEFEKDLVSDASDPSSSRVQRSGVGLLVASVGVVAGLLVLFIGLRLASAIGTLVGVAGTLVLVVSAWLGVQNVSQRPRPGMTSGRDDPKP